MVRTSLIFFNDPRLIPFFLDEHEKRNLGLTSDALFGMADRGRVLSAIEKRLAAPGAHQLESLLPLHERLAADRAAVRAGAGAKALELVKEETSKPGDQMNCVYGVSRRLSWGLKLIYLLTGADRTPLWRWLIGDSLLATAFRKTDHGS